MSKHAKSGHNNNEQSVSTPFPLKVWYVGMFFSMASLHVLGIISRDDSVNSYVILGIIAMFIPSVINTAKEVSSYIESRREHEEREQKAAETRERQHQEEMQEQEKVMAASELAKRNTTHTINAQNASGLPG